MTYRVAPVAIGTTKHNEAALGPAKVPRSESDGGIEIQTIFSVHHGR